MHLVFGLPYYHISSTKGMLGDNLKFNKLTNQFKILGLLLKGLALPQTQNTSPKSKPWAKEFHQIMFTHITTTPH